MTKSLMIKLSLTIASLGLVALLFSFPKEIVRKKENQQPASTVSEAEKKSQKLEFTEEIRLETDRLKSVYTSLPEDSLKQKLFVLDTLFEFYGMYGRVEEVALWLETLPASNIIQDEVIANIYFDLFQSETSEGKKRVFGKKAIQFYNKIMVVDPERLDLLTRKAVVQIETESPPMKGVTNLKNALNLAPENPEGWMYLARFQDRVQMLDKAIESYKKVLVYDPENLYAAIRLGEIYAFRENIPKAIVYYEMAVRNTTDSLVISALQKELKKLKK